MSIRSNIEQNNVHNLRWNKANDSIEINIDGKWKLWKTAGMLSYDLLVPILSADSDAIIHSFTNYESFNHYKAFDGLDNSACIAKTGTTTTGAYFGYSLTNEYVLRQIVLKYRQASNSSSNYIFKVQYRKDGEWYDFNDGETFSISTESKVNTLIINLDNPMLCDAFRIYFTGGSTYLYSTNNYGLQIVELGAYGSL